MQLNEQEMRAVVIDREALILAVNMLGSALDDVHGFIDRVLENDVTESGVEYPKLSPADAAEAEVAHALIVVAGEQLGGIIAERDRIVAEMVTGSDHPEEGGEGFGFYL